MYGERSDGGQPVTYDPNYDDPETWTPKDVTQYKYNPTDEGRWAASEGRLRPDPRRTDPEPQ